METINAGEYKIPEGHVVKIKDGIITIRETKRKGPDGYRCKDCIHCIQGFTTKGSWWISQVCEKKPKGFTNFKGKDCFRAVKHYDKICEHFKLKENDTKSEEQP